jgi:SHS2 domain-containing protein
MDFSLGVNMGKRYEFLPHTADAKFRAYGRTLEEALANAALAMISLMWEWEKIKPVEREIIKVNASSLEQLIVKFLTEFLYLLEVKSFMLSQIDNLKIKQIKEGDRTVYQLEAGLRGDRISPYYEIYGEVKAVTYSDMKIERRVDGFVLQLVVDM